MVLQDIKNIDIVKNNSEKKLSSIISKTTQRDNTPLNRIKRKDHIDEVINDGHDRQVIHVILKNY